MIPHDARVELEKKFWEFSSPGSSSCWQNGSWNKKLQFSQLISVPSLHSGLGDGWLSQRSLELHELGRWPLWNAVEPFGVRNGGGGCHDPNVGWGGLLPNLPAGNKVKDHNSSCLEVNKAVKRKEVAFFWGPKATFKGQIFSEFFVTFVGETGRDLMRLVWVEQKLSKLTLWGSSSASCLLYNVYILYTIYIYIRYFIFVIIYIYIL